MLRGSYRKVFRVGVRELYSGLELEKCAQGWRERTILRVGVRELYTGLELENGAQGEL